MRLLCLFVVLPVAGCLEPGRPDSQWATQIDSALLIPNPQSRANSLGTLAQSAAYDNDPASVRYALDQIGPGPKHDQMAAACVAQLAAKDKAAARKLAARIGDESKRAEVLSKLDGPA